MADGYARLTGQPQCVIVHVDVGTQGLGAAVHNASCGRAPVLIFAGLSPFTIEGEMRTGFCISDSVNLSCRGAPVSRSAGVAR